MNWKKDKENNERKYKQSRERAKAKSRFYNARVRKIKSETVKVGNWTFDKEDV